METETARVLFGLVECRALTSVSECSNSLCCFYYGNATAPCLCCLLVCLSLAWLYQCIARFCYIVCHTKQTACCLQLLMLVSYELSVMSRQVNIGESG